MNSGEIRKGAAAPFLLAAVAALAGLLLALHGGHGVEAQGGSMIGIDVQPESNTPSSLGTLETCVSHKVGDSFPVDIFVNNVSSLRSWELRIDYDENVLKIANVDYARFLVSTPPGGNVFPTLQDSEAPGREFLAAAEFSGPADSGSGALARLTLEAVGKGDSQLQIVNSPSYLGPRLTGAQGVPIGDSSGDDIWDDSITGAKVVVGGDCSGSPVITPKPSPRATPTLPPGATARPTPTNAPAPTPTPIGEEPSVTPAATDGDGNVVILIPGDTVTPGTDPGSAGGTPGSGSDNPNGGSVATPGNDGGTGAQQAGDNGGGGSSVWLIAAGLAAAVLLAGGGVLYTFSRRNEN